MFFSILKYVNIYLWLLTNNFSFQRFNNQKNSLLNVGNRAKY
jgi:hypothetical protein